MATTMYSTVLPDSAGDEYEVDPRQIQRPQYDRKAPYQKVVGAKNNPDAMPRNQREASGDSDPVIKKMIDNKTLTHGLIGIIIVLVILLVVQIVRSRNMVSAPPQQSDPPPPQQQNYYAQSRQCMAPNNKSPGQSTQKIDDAMYAHYMKKAPPAKPAAQKGAAMASFSNGRKQSDDDARLATIIEEATEPADPEQENMRATINDLLKKEDANDHGLAAGSQVVEDADADVKREIARKQENSVPSDRLADETLATGDDDEYEEPVTKPSQAAPALCNVILKSGTRAGQTCFSAVVSGSDKCVRHQKKAK